MGKNSQQSFTQTKGNLIMNTQQPIKHYVVPTAKALAAVFALAVLVHVSWNMFAPDMFGLEAIRMKQALGLVMFLGVVAFVTGFGRHRKTGTAAS